MLNITRNCTADKAVFCLEGRLDTSTATDLENQLKECPDSVTELVLDLEKLEYISSVGLRVLLSAHKAMAGKGTMKIIHADEMIMEIFDVPGFSDILNIE